MKTYHLVYVWDWYSGRRYWQASTELDCLSPDAVYYTTVTAKSKKQAIQEGRRKHYDERKRKHEQREQRLSS